MLMSIYCEVEGCGRYANVIFQEGTHLEKCPTCGDDHSVNDYHELCYEHAYLHLREQHQETMAGSGYFNTNTLRSEKLIVRREVS